MLLLEKTPAVKTVRTLTPAEVLQKRILGEVCLPGTPAYDEARKAWVAHVDQQPALIVVAHNADDISEAVRYARAQSLSVAVQSTGHGGITATPDSLLLVTKNMKGIRVNAQQRTAYVEAGAKWGVVLNEAQKVGLTPLLGSTTDVNAVGYTLGGGMGWLARKYGLAADSVNAFDVVTADGERRRVSATQQADLFWALRGGGGGFAIVTGMEIRLYPVTQVYAGNLLYPISMAREVIQRWRDWAPSASDDLTTAIVLMNYPPIPQMPDFLRGQSFVMVRGCYTGESLEGGQSWVQSWRNWHEPLHNFWDTIPLTQANEISQDPIDPSPSLSDGGWLSELSDDAIDALIVATRPPNGHRPAILFNEVRHVGGAISRVSEAESPLGHRDAQFVLNSVGLALSPQTQHAFEQALNTLKQRLAPVLVGVYQNFVAGAERQASASRIFSAGALRRLAEIKTKYDPTNLLRHSVRFA